MVKFAQKVLSACIGLISHVCPPTSHDAAAAAIQPKSSAKQLRFVQAPEDQCILPVERVTAISVLL